MPHNRRSTAFGNRRKLANALGAGAHEAPPASLAQQQDKVWRVGFLGYFRRPDPFDSHFISEFPRAMRELGYIEGKNLVIEWRFPNREPERLPSLAAELVQLKVDVITTGSTPATSAAQKATSTIPIVILAELDPIGNGFVESLARPGGNITGLSSVAVNISPNYLEMLRSMVPELSRVAVLVNPDNPVAQSAILKSIQAAGQKIGVTILSFDARISQEIEKGFAQMAHWKAEALIVARDPLLNKQIRQIAELAAKNQLPTISGGREYVEAGGLISYGPSFADLFRRGATYVDRILKGAKPSDLPVEQPTKFEMFINRKAAKALGLTIPQSLLIMVDKVIE